MKTGLFKLLISILIFSAAFPPSIWAANQKQRHSQVNIRIHDQTNQHQCAVCKQTTEDLRPCDSCNTGVCVNCVYDLTGVMCSVSDCTGTLKLVENTFFIDPNDKNKTLENMKSQAKELAQKIEERQNKLNILKTEIRSADLKASLSRSVEILSTEIFQTLQNASVQDFEFDPKQVRPSLIKILKDQDLFSPSMLALLSLAPVGLPLVMLGILYSPFNQGVSEKGFLIIRNFTIGFLVFVELLMAFVFSYTIYKDYKELKQKSINQPPFFNAFKKAVSLELDKSKLFVHINTEALVENLACAEALKEIPAKTKFKSPEKL